MSKRQEIRARRQRERLQRRFWVIGLVVLGALALAYFFIQPLLSKGQPVNTANVQVTPIATRTFKTTVSGLHLGDPNAPVKIDVWEDFQCSACLGYTQSIEPQVLSGLIETGKVYYTFHFFPFIETLVTPNTTESHNAANAAMCANDQGRFWDYHDILYANWLGENAGSYTDVRLTKMAEVLGLDMTKFNACYQSRQFNAQIDQDMTAGTAKGVQGTPSVFVNGTLLTPGNVPSYNDILQAVDKIVPGK